MKINVLTLFPEMFSAVTGSILGRACEKGILEFRFINIRDFSQDKHKKADDYTFGGGPGLLMLADPIFGALEHIDADKDRDKKKLLYMSPRGKVLDQTKIEELAAEKEITILCGHYEGVDQRVLDYWQMEEVSLGDYVLTGGELAAMVLMDSVARLVPGVLPRDGSATEESIYSGLLEYPQYTKPRDYRGMEVPEILLSGNHKLIDLWRFEEALRLTKEVRPDLFEKFVRNREDLTKDERKVLEKILK